MRGAFNKTCELVYGPESPYGPPGVMYLSGVPCRYVPQRLIFQDDFPLILTDSWMTIEASPPNTPLYLSNALGEWHARIYTADIVSISGVVGSPWYAIRREDMLGPRQAPYYRVELLPLSLVAYPHWLPPSPPPPPGPGASCATATPVVLPLGYTGPVGGGVAAWWTYTETSGTPYTLTISGTTQPGTTTDVYTGGCLLPMPYKGPIIGNGFVSWTPIIGQQIWIRVQGVMPDTFTVSFTSP